MATKTENFKATQQLKYHINHLLKIGFKKYELKISKGYGVYFIELPHPAYSISKLDEIGSSFQRGTLIGYYPAITKGSLSIKTTIKV